MIFKTIVEMSWTRLLLKYSLCFVSCIKLLETLNWLYSLLLSLVDFSFLLYTLIIVVRILNTKIERKSLFHTSQSNNLENIPVIPICSIRRTIRLCKSMTNMCKNMGSCIFTSIITSIIIISATIYFRSSKCIHQGSYSIENAQNDLLICTQNEWLIINVTCPLDYNNVGWLNSTIYCLSNGQKIPGYISIPKKHLFIPTINVFALHLLIISIILLFMLVCYFTCKITNFEEETSDDNVSETTIIN